MAQRECCSWSMVIGAFSIVAFFIAVRQLGRRDADARQVRTVVDVGGVIIATAVRHVNGVQ